MVTWEKHAEVFRSGNRTPHPLNVSPQRVKCIHKQMWQKVKMSVNPDEEYRVQNKYYSGFFFKNRIEKFKLKSR